MERGAAAVRGRGGRHRVAKLSGMSANAEPSAELPASVDEVYSFLGPSGTFTEAALAQVPEARGKRWRAVNNVGEALADVVAGRSVAAMIAIENSIEGGVSVAQDALATSPACGSWGSTSSR